MLTRQIMGASGTVQFIEYKINLSHSASGGMDRRHAYGHIEQDLTWNGMVIGDEVRKIIRNPSCRKRNIHLVSQFESGPLKGCEFNM